MINVEKLWRQRFIQTNNETRKYLRYMLNDHLLFVLLILLGGSAYSYKNWVDTLSADFPYLFIIPFILAFVLTNSPIRTFLKEADIAFLLQIEQKLSRYFKYSIYYSLFIQTFWIIITLVVLYPIYQKFTQYSFIAGLFIFVLLLIMKLWNLFMKWNVQYFHDAKVQISDFIVRFVLNFIFLYFLFAKANIIFLCIVAFMMFFLYWYFKRASQSKTLKWEYLIEQEAKRMLLFYRIANLFTDVPKLKNRVKRRKWLDWALNFIHYSKQHTYSYLYLRTFLRTSDYFGLYIRLTLIGGLGLYFLPFYYGKLFITILFIYLTGFQLMTLWKQHDVKLWVSLYPVSKEQRLKSFIKLLTGLLMIQACLLSVFFILNGQMMLTFLSILCGGSFSWIMANLYIKNKVKKFN